MWVCLVVALVSVKGIYMYADMCYGSINVREPVIQNRSISVTFTLASLDQYTAVWTIGTDSNWYKQKQFPGMFDKIFQNSSTCSLILTNYMKAIQQRYFSLRVELMDDRNNVVCYEDTNIEMADLGECGNLSVSDTFIRKGPVDLVLMVKDTQEYRSFTLLFINDADDQAILYHESMGERALPFTYTLDTPRSDGIYLVMCDADVKRYSTSLRLKKAERPNFTEIKLYDVIAGEEGTIECVSTDMRPASNLILNVDGISCNITQDVSENNNTDTYNVIATCLLTASKTLHNKTVKCCFSDLGDRHCQTKQLNILFPPGHVEAKQVESKDDEEKFKQTVLSCYVSSANPPCRARWEIMAEITDYRTENFSSTIGLNDREEILSKLFLNATRLNHGQQIQCLAVCGNFEVKSNVVSLNVPGAPLMKLFPGNIVTKREGESLTLNCTVDSIPKSNLSWNHGKDTLLEQGSAGCDSFSKCYQTYHFESLGKSQTGNYTCTAHNDQFEPTEEIVLLRVIEPDSVTGNNENLLKKTWFIPAVAGGGAAVLIVIIIVVVITVSRRKKTKINSMEPNGHNERQDAGDQIQGEIEEEHDATIGGEQGAGVENVTYATVVKDNVRPSTSKDRQVSHDDGQESKEESKEGGNASSITEQVQIDNTYAQILPRAERQKQSQNVKASASGEKELVYLDVEFNKALPGSKVKGGRQSDVERTEYVSIDFNKKAPTDS